MSTDEGSLSLLCRATLCADAVTVQLLHTTITILVAEVADLRDRLNL